MASGPTTPHDYNSKNSDNAGSTGEGAQSAKRLIQVLVDFQLEDPLIRRIEQVDPRLHVQRTFQRTNDVGEVTTLENWNRADEATVDGMLAGAEVLFGFNFPLDWLRRATLLKWVHLASAGSDTLQRAGVFDIRPDLILTTSSGVHEVPISEHIVASILYFARRFNIAVGNQPQHKWARYEAGEAHARTALLIGYGPIARRTATLCKALGMRVLVVRASISEQQPGDDLVDRYYPNAQLDEALAQSDYTVIAAPRTPSTEGMIGRAQFAAMKPTAVLINISRGALVDEDAMIAALSEGRLAGAGLDVFQQEPLPESSPLWDMPNVLITPHNSGSNPHYNERAITVFTDNLMRYLRGEPLKNRVIRERGY